MNSFIMDVNRCHMMPIKNKQTTQKTQEDRRVVCLRVLTIDCTL